MTLLQAVFELLDLGLSPTGNVFQLAVTGSSNSHDTCSLLTDEAHFSMALTEAASKSLELSFIESTLIRVVSKCAFGASVSGFNSGLVLSGLSLH